MPHKTQSCSELLPGVKQNIKVFRLGFVTLFLTTCRLESKATPFLHAGGHNVLFLVSSRGNKFRPFWTKLCCSTLDPSQDMSWLSIKILIKQKRTTSRTEWKIEKKFRSSLGICIRESQVQDSLMGRCHVLDLFIYRVRILARRVFVSVLTGMVNFLHSS